MIKISRALYNEIIEYASANCGEESCGLLWGKIQGDIKVVKVIYPIENIEHSSEHFVMNTSQQIEAAKAMRIRTYSLIGSFHSHINEGAVPSGEDIALAYESELSYGIVSLRDSEIRFYKIENNSYTQEKCVII